MENMEKNVFSVETSAEAAWLNVEIKDYSELDEIAMRVVSQDCPEFLLPIHMAEKNGISSLRYRLISGMALAYNLRRNMNKSAFLDFALKLMAPFTKCKNWFLDYHYLCIDPRYILLDKVSNQYVFLYVPLREFRNSDEEIIRFFEKVFTDIDIPDDRTYQIALSRYFRDNQVQLDSLGKMLLAEKNKIHEKTIERKMPEEPVSHVVSKPAVNLPPVPEEKMQLNVAPEPEELDVPENKGKKNPGGNLMGLFDRLKTKEKKQPANAFEDIDLEAMDDFNLDVNGIQDAKKPKKSAEKAEKKEKAKNIPELQKQPDIQTKYAEPEKKVPETIHIPQMINNGGTLSGEMFDDDVTNVINDSMMKERKYLELIDTVTADMPPKIISLEFPKDYITFGRSSSHGGNSELDVIFPQRSGVSREHLRIARQGNRLVVVDLGSTNYTLLDGQRLIPNIEYTLQDGMLLTLAERRPIRYRVHC